MKKYLSKNSSKSSLDSQPDPNRSALFGNRPAPSPRTSPAPDSRANDPYARPDPYASRGYQETSRPSPPPRGYSNASIDPNRNALFGNRPPPSAQDRYGRDPYGPSHVESEPDRFDEYQQQAEGSDEDVEAIKQEIRFTKQESLSSTRNAIRIASEAEEQGRNTLTRLGAQSEKLSGVEKNLDISAAHARIAEEKARELKKLNRSIFAVHVSNPFNKTTRAEEEERKITERHEMEREERERSRKYAYDSAKRVDSALNKPGSGRKPTSGGAAGRSTVAQRSQFSFEEDEEDIQMEKDIDANLNTLGDITSRLKGLALATQTEVLSQNTKLDQIADKVWSILSLLTLGRRIGY